ncbi:hypothetical protein BRPE64_ECDS00840 (plasmid) [Caballeronia insecticola]|uniref:Uncharacterized protein n=1 Tax=Caballeronia insecticola TaxID=758793 RepID=R4X5H5_9BURK|nr:hypothetical protein BRPE64_ECDS00840 [Caballeronia insecticola]
MANSRGFAQRQWNRIEDGQQLHEGIAHGSCHGSDEQAVVMLRNCVDNSGPFCSDIAIERCIRLIDSSGSSQRA